MSTPESAPTLRHIPSSPFKVPPDMNYNIQRFLLAPPETDHFTPWTSCSCGTFPPSACPRHDFVTFNTREYFASFLKGGWNGQRCFLPASTRSQMEVVALRIMPEITLHPFLSSDINCASGPGAEYGSEQIAGNLEGGSDSQDMPQLEGSKKM